MIVVDVEASGVNPKKHSLISIGAVDFSTPNNTFYDECKIWDGARVMVEALQVNGFTNEQITDANKQTEGELLTKFIKWAKNIDERTIAGQNPSFDRDFMMSGADRFGINWQFAYRTIDLHSLAYAHQINNGITPRIEKHHSILSLDVIALYCGLKKEPKPHNALTGAKYEAECFSRLLYNKKLLPEFSEINIPWIKLKKPEKNLA